MLNHYGVLPGNCILIFIIFTLTSKSFIRVFDYFDDRQTV